MIEFLTIWVKTIIFVVLFATFLEFLLPNSSMQRFVKVIMGLFIMLTVLNPIVDTIHNYQSSNIFAMGRTADDTIILSAAQKLAQDRDDLARELYKSDIAKQAYALVMAIDGITDAKIVVTLSETDKKKVAGCKIKKLEVYIQPGLMKKSEKIAKVEINPSSNSYQDITPELAQKVKKNLCEFYQLKDDQIIVNYFKQNKKGE